MSLPYIEAEGDAYQIGRVIDEAGAGAYCDVVTRLARFKALERDWAGGDRLSALQCAAAKAYPEILREIEGIADGIGASFEQVFLWNCRGDFPDRTSLEEALAVLARGDRPAAFTTPRASPEVSGYSRWRRPPGDVWCDALRTQWPTPTI